MDIPNKKYAIIYADPPWQYNSRIHNVHNESKAENFYPTLSTEELIKIDIQSISDDNCLLFIWASGPFFHHAIRLGEGWGFKYITVGFVWDKINQVVGSYTMSSCEFCLIFKKGTIPKPRGERNISQFLSCKKGQHSVKPLEIKHRIQKMFPEQDKIELFARPGLLKYINDNWDYWGNEV